MLQIKKFVFNPFQVNAYVLYDESGKCVLIDPAVADNSETLTLETFIQENNLRPQLVINTHSHIDHLLGNTIICQLYRIKLAAHPAGQAFIDRSVESAKRFGLQLSQTKAIDISLEDNQEIKFGQTNLKVMYTPGHADGSICLYHAESGIVISGDVLFRDTIGRTDLPTGDYNVLQKSIWDKLFTLPDETKVYPGHGPETTIGSEKVNNPFVAIGM
jgi:hydroxyacylglutathione hydrolase